MSWFQSTNLANFAKTALKDAQKVIDKALDINEEEDGGGGGGASRNNQTGISRSITSATGIASDFFASWGVGDSTDSATNNTPNTETSSNLSPASNSNDNDNSESKPDSNNSSSDSKSAISPRKTTSEVVEDFRSIASENNVDEVEITGKERTKIESSIELKVPSSSSTQFNVSSSSPQLIPVASDQNRDELVLKQDDDGTISFTKCDFVESSGNLVQCLDDDSFTSPSSIVTQSGVGVESERSVSPVSNNSSSSANTLKFQSSSTTSSSIGAETVVGKDSDVTPISLAGNSVDAEKTPKKGNLELLQEIDLNSTNDGGWGEDFNQEKLSASLSPSEINNPSEVSGAAHGTNDFSNPVIESSLSDGWDWTSSLSGTESYLHGTLNPTLYSSGSDAKNAKDAVISASKDSPADEEVKVVVQPIQTDAQPDFTENSAITAGVDQIFSREEEEPFHTSEALPDDSIHIPLSTSPSCDDNSSRLQDQDEHGRVDQERESTASSFELVSTNVDPTCACPPQPESSRSSSIVVVSGRDSAPNSRGTSGAGSSGCSSEVGHDHDDVDGNISRVRRHKKGASSSSSSDIEVIPSDYSSSSPALPEPDTAIALLSSSPLKKYSSVQTQSAPTELRDSQVQTDQISEDKSISSVSEEDLSKYVSTKVADILAEKEQEVQQLREEGEKLSVKQYELSQVIKKLRAKEKETEGVVKGLRTEMATKNLELEKLMKTFISKEGIEQTQNDTISKLSQERIRLELKVEELNSELEDAKDNVESMKATVENASIEILELKNVISSVQRESAEVDRLTRDKAELLSRTESLQKEVDHLRTVLNTSQSSHHSREAELKSEISMLTQKVHQLENSLSDISSEVADATMPLSMEIEKLQGELKHQANQYDRREHAMQSTISDLELKLNTASEREKAAKDLQMKYQSQNSTLELRVEEMEVENRNLKEQLLQKEEIFKKKSEDKAAHYRKLEKTVERLTGEVERLSTENTDLANELQTERTSLEAEVRKNQSLIMDSNNSREGNSIFDQSSSSSATYSHRLPHNAYHKRTGSMASSTGGSQHSSSQRTLGHEDSHTHRSSENSPSDHSINFEENSNSYLLDEVFDPNTGMMIGAGGSDNLNNRSMTPKSFFESFSSANLIENLQGQLRLREGELIALQEKLSKNEKIRKQLNEEIANLTMHNQQLEVEMEKMAEMQSKLDDLDKNYNAVLQMYGEKVEEADELRMDLDDVKEMYKAQIEQLLKKS